MSAEDARNTADEERDAVETMNDDDLAQPLVARKSDSILVLLVFALFYGYDLLEGLTNLVGVPEIYEMIGRSDVVPWPLLIVGVLAPALLFAGAMAVGRGRGIVAKSGILLAGLVASATISLTLEEVARFWAANALGL
ncbi:hypothetical protein [Humidisolicoccus flavus]|uniref:hypothetical protein n=1 Tax=Humidisolicoccus flavus TaxID=3111414 RepID=UPI00324BF769